MIKYVILIVLFFALGISSYYLYNSIQDLQASPFEFLAENNLSDEIDMSAGLQFYPNMRFSDTTISYFISDSCNSIKRENMKQAFDTLSSMTLLNFFENASGQIVIECEERVGSKPKERYYIAGEGGPTLVLNTSSFYIIEKGEILLLYNTEDCNSPNIEIHELLHVLGFKHSNDSTNILFPTSVCSQTIHSDILNEINPIYSVPSLPDIYFDDISATKHGIYLDFSVSVRNKGLRIAENISLDLYNENGKFTSFNLESLEPGQGKSLDVTNAKLPSRSTRDLKFVLVTGEELELSNNIAKFSIVESE